MSLDVLRIIAIVGVVAIHTFSWVVTNPEQVGSVQRVVAIAVDLGFVWAVPVFVMISGALILRPSTFARGIPSFYRSRALRLVPALVFWNLVYLFIAKWFLLDVRPSLRGLVEMTMDGRFYTQLYFLWIVLGLYLVAPVLAAFLKDGGTARALITAGVALVWAVVVFTLPITVDALFGVQRPIAVSFLLLWLPYVGYFLAGYALSLVELRRWMVWSALAVAVATGALTIWQYASRGSVPLLDALSPVSYYGPIVAVLSVAVFVFFVGTFDTVTFRPRDHPRHHDPLERELRGVPRAPAGRRGDVPLPARLDRWRVARPRRRSASASCWSSRMRSRSARREIPYVRAVF